MQKNSYQHLEALKKALSDLAKYTLPVDTRGALLNARQRLNQLESSLKKDDSKHHSVDAVYRVARSLGSTLDLDEVLNNVMDAVIELTGAERGFLMLVDNTTGELSLRAARNFARETLDHEDMEISRTVIQSVLEKEEGIVATDAQSDPRFAEQESVVFYDLRSILCAPLIVRGEVIGVIYVDNRAKSGIFEKEDLELLNVFAAQAAVAIENARLYTQTDQALAARVQELEILSTIDRDLNARLDFEYVLQITREWAEKGTGGEESWVFLYGEDTEKLLLAAGPSGDSEPNPPRRDIIQILKQPGSSLETRVKGDLQFLIAPLNHAGRTLGALVISHQEDFTPEAIQFINRLIGRAVTSLANNQLYQAVEQANRAKSQFLAIVTHELRIPLTSIKGYTDLILKGKAGGEISDQGKEFLKVIHNNVDRMADLISDLSDISRIERGILNLEIETTSLQDCLQVTLDSLRHKIQEREQTLHVDVNGIPPLETDPSRLTQVLTNLISNAWKYTPDGGEIFIRAKQQDHQIRLEVQDTGIGIKPEEQTKLFTQFFRSEDQQVRDQNGWGLGLNVTKNLVEMLGGEIGFQSTYGEGSTFWFTLPLEHTAQNE
jgi:signal transduction histidine kinase